jgi:pSer/pThr/pTyr-binding forkhead associated (FHA) protein
MKDDLKTVRAPIYSQRDLCRQLRLRKCLLVVEAGQKPDIGKRFGPLGERTTIGRDEWCDIPLSDPGVSEQHCELTLTSDGVWMHDRNSTNGVMFKDRRVSGILLAENDQFRVFEI